MSEEIFGAKSSIYVSDLHHHETESTCRELFSPFGNITSVLVKRYKSLERCYAFITYEKYEEAYKAFLEMNFKRYKGLNIGVQFTSIETRKMRENKEGLLLVKNLSSELTQQDVLRYFANIGDIIFCHVPRVYQNIVGFALIQYRDVNDSKKALESLNRQVLKESEIKVEYASQLPIYKRFTMVRAYNIAENLFNIDSIRNIFSIIGQVSEVKINSSSSSSDITYTEHIYANYALEFLNGLVLNEAALKVEISPNEFTGETDSLSELVLHLSDEQPFTKVHISGLSDEYDCGQKIRELAERFGKVHSQVLNLSEKSSSLKTATVVMQSYEDALSLVVGIRSLGMKAERTQTREEMRLNKLKYDLDLYLSQQNSANDRKVFVELTKEIDQETLKSLFELKGEVRVIKTLPKCAYVIFNDSAVVTRCLESPIVCENTQLNIKVYNKSTNMPALRLGQSFAAAPRFPFKREAVEKLKDFVKEIGYELTDKLVSEVNSEVAKFLMKRPYLIRVWLEEEKKQQNC